MKINYSKLKHILQSEINTMEWEEKHQEYRYKYIDGYKQLLECVKIAEKVGNKHEH
jgi:hypothetical protein